jgi:16S rRNA processing protein RimM
VSSSTSSTIESSSADWLSAGAVGRPHGLDGSFYVAQPRPALLELGKIVRIAGRDAQITRRAGTDRRPIVRLDGAENRDAIEPLRGQELMVPRTETPALEDDEWWAEDLEGCAVHDAGQPVGTVSRLLALPSCEVLEVERAAGGGALLVPLIRDAVRSVDVERREIEIDLGFLAEAE